MIRSIMGEIDVGKSLGLVLGKIKAAAEHTPREIRTRQPRLVAVSKTKAKELIISAYENGQRHFGENYVQELVEKGNDPDINRKCPDIRWHLIGHLQRNKINKVVSIPGLFVIETVDSQKLASTLDTVWSKLHSDKRLRVMVQVNTSGEKEKSGCKPEETPALVKYIISSCQGLQFVGLMTIGVYGYDTTLGPNPDFICLRNLRADVCSELGLNMEDVELSMGMSDDFEQAIELGSTNVRVGSLIFGVRQKKNSNSDKADTEKGLSGLELKKIDEH